MKKILLVDHLKANIEKEEQILSRANLLIFTARSAEEALEIHKREKVDIIIADLDMPGMDGDELCSIIRKDDTLKNVSIILVCLCDKSSIKRCEDSGANIFVTKPIDPEDLQSKIRELLNIAARGSMRVLLQVTVEGKSGEHTFLSTTENISVSGVLIRTDKVLEKGEKINCSFILDSHQIITGGEVLRVERVTSEQSLYGVKFIDIDPKSRSLIEEFVKRRKEI